MTTAAVVAGVTFMEKADAIMAACGSAVALHVRVKTANARALYDAARQLASVAASHGSSIIVNERMDVALAVGAAGVHLGRRSIPVTAAARTGLRTGYSAHSAAEAESAGVDGADYVFLGTIWASASHPGECTAGVEALSAAAGRVPCPVLAIGGVTASRSQEALLAGAHGVAVISGVWDADDPAAAAMEYLELMQAVS